MERSQLVQQSKIIWARCRGGDSPTQTERDVLLEAYWASVLPEDPDYSVYQWVEDGFPSFD